MTGSLGHVPSVGPPQASPLLEGSCIDNPVSGDQLTSYEIRVRGWVVGRRSRVATVQLIDRSLRRVFRESPLNGPRPDVADHYPHVNHARESGFQIPFSLLNLHPVSSVEIIAVLQDGSSIPLGTASFCRNALVSGYLPRLQPLMVSCLGRSGSTYLMKILKHHPQVVVHGDAPCPNTIPIICSSVSSALEYVGIAGHVELVEEILTKARAIDRDAHRTSASAESSIGRWRQDLPRPFRKSCDRAFAEALDVFYE